MHLMVVTIRRYLCQKNKERGGLRAVPLFIMISCTLEKTI